jgi:integrase
MSKRKEVPTQYPDILKILVLSAEGKWAEPKNGKKFKARRYERQSDGTLRRIKRSFESLAEAKVFRLSTQSGENLNAFTENVATSKPTTETMAFDELLESWKKNWLPSVDLATQLRYQKYLKHLHFFSGMKVVEINPAAVDAWIAHVKSPEYLRRGNPTRINYEHEFKILRAVLTYYSTRCNRNYRLPFLRDHRKMLKVRDATIVKKDLTIEQFSSFLSELKALCWNTKRESIYYLAIMQYAIYGRIQEAAALHVEDFDLTNNRLEIKRKVQWMRSRGHDNRIVPGSKANGGKIFSPIPDLALQVLREWKLRSGVRSGLLFMIENDLVEYRQIQYKYDRALKNAKLPFTATHILRHAALVEAYSTSPNILAIQRLAGHKSLQATEKYAKVRDEQVAEVQRLMDEKLSSVSRGI